MSDRYQSLSSQRILQHRAKKRAEKSNWDYVVTAFSPILIMLLVGSLVFFLIQVFYHGEMAGGIRWVMFWFVLAIVLVSRIGIEQSPAHATLYGAALAVATWLFLVRTHPAFLLGIILLATVWWSADRLVKDCTLIDEDADSSDRGLLERSKRPPNKVKQAPKKRGKKVSPNAARDGSGAQHSPGRWILYYSLAALPLFGLGQLFNAQQGVSDSGFNLLIVYLMAAAGLLLSTSFLGLRRYLRQRSLNMPSGIAGQWLISGGKLAALVFIFALLVPRPGVANAWTGLGGGVEHVIRRASQVALKFNPSGTGEGATGNQSQSDDSAAEGSATETQSEESEASEAAGRQNQSRSQGQSQSSENPAPTNATSSNTSPNSSPALRGLVYFIIALALLVALFRYRREIWAVLQAAWAALLRFLETSRERSRENKKRQRPTPPKRKSRKNPFHRYRNPFASGAADQWSPEALVAYTFEALGAWAEKEGNPIQDHLTPIEQVHEWTARHPYLGDEAIRLGRSYSQLAYQNRLPSDFDPRPLKMLWATLT